MKQIYTSYFGNYKNIPSEYQCVSIANSKPDSINIPTWKEVRPNWSDVEAYKSHKITACQFAERYKSKLDTIRPIEALDYLNKFNADTIVLLCWESSYLYCHRYILALWLTYTLNLTIEELH